MSLLLAISHEDVLSRIPQSSLRIPELNDTQKFNCRLWCGVEGTSLGGGGDDFCTLSDSHHTLLLTSGHAVVNKVLALGCYCVRSIYRLKRHNTAIYPTH